MDTQKPPATSRIPRGAIESLVAAAAALVLLGLWLWWALAEAPPLG